MFSALFMQSVLIISQVLYLCKVSLLPVLYMQMCPYYFVLYMQSVGKAITGHRGSPHRQRARALEVLSAVAVPCHVVGGAARPLLAPPPSR